MKKYLIINIIFFGVLFVLPANAQAAVLYEEVNFFVDSKYDAFNRSELNATLREIGGNIYFYVDNEYYNTLNGTYKNGLREELEILADEFDNVIYPKLRAVFGSEWNPGIDNDDRITVLISQLVNSAGGYINTYDAYSKEIISNSNEREIIYLNALNIFNKNNKAFLAHEFQHLITLHQKSILYGVEEEVWLNEARSEYAPTICGYNDIYNGSYLANRVGTFLESPSDSLTEWKNELDDYGVVSLFMHYLVDHYGNEILTKMMMNNQVGIASINNALLDLGYPETFSDIFMNWGVANYLNNCNIGSDNKYCYLNDDLTYNHLNVDYSASYSGFPNLIVSRSSSIKDWSSYWYRFRQGGRVDTDRDNLKLEFEGLGNKSDFKVSYIVSGYRVPTEVKSFSIENQKGTVYVPNFTSLNKSIILIPSNQYKKSGFGSDELSSSFSFTATSVSEIPVIIEEEETIVNYPEGSLLRAKNGYKVYIIKGNYKRWIQTAEIFNNYGHLNWDDIIDVDLKELNQYKDAWMIRADGDKRVYELNADATKHWLNMTAEQFTQTGHRWDMVFIVNDWERDFYTTGVDVMFN